MIGFFPPRPCTDTPRLAPFDYIKCCIEPFCPRLKRAEGCGPIVCGQRGFVRRIALRREAIARRTWSCLKAPPVLAGNGPIMNLFRRKSRWATARSDIFPFRFKMATGFCSAHSGFVETDASRRFRIRYECTRESCHWETGGKEAFASRFGAAELVKLELPDGRLRNSKGADWNVQLNQLAHACFIGLVHMSNRCFVFGACVSIASFLSAINLIRWFLIKAAFRRKFFNWCGLSEE